MVARSLTAVVFSAFVLGDIATTRAQTRPTNGSAQQNRARVWAAIATRRPNTLLRQCRLCIGDDGVVVIDTHERRVGPAPAQQIRKLTPLPYGRRQHAYHGDHVGGNKAFADLAPCARASQRGGWIHAKICGCLEPPTRAQDVRRTTRRTRVATRMRLPVPRLPSVQVRSFPGPGRRSVIVVPDAKVVFGGDLLWRG